MLSFNKGICIINCYKNLQEKKVFRNLQNTSSKMDTKNILEKQLKSKKRLMFFHRLAKCYKHTPFFLGLVQHFIFKMSSH